MFYLFVDVHHGIQMWTQFPPCGILNKYWKTLLEYVKSVAAAFKVRSENVSSET